MPQGLIQTTPTNGSPAPMRTPTNHAPNPGHAPLQHQALLQTTPPKDKRRPFRIAPPLNQSPAPPTVTCPISHNPYIKPRPQPRPLSCAPPSPQSPALSITCRKPRLVPKPRPFSIAPPRNQSPAPSPITCQTNHAPYYRSPAPLFPRPQPRHAMLPSTD